MRKNAFLMFLGFAGLMMVLLASTQALAQESGADDFAMPAAGSGTTAAEKTDKPDAAAPGATAETKADPGATPADPAETPGPAESPTGDAPAATPAEGGGDAAASPPPVTLEEPEQIEVLSAKFKFTPGNESKDPFKPLVIKKVQLPPAPTPVARSSGPVGPPPPPPPKPIQLFVSGVCGNETERLAMIMFENKPYVVSKDMVVDGKFKVVDILPDRLVVYSNKEQMRRTFPIGGGKP